MLGRTISHYEIVEKLGEGGMGVVYKAEDTKLKRSVALKFLRSDVLEDDEHKARFLREAQAAASLIHPNICVIHEIDEAEGASFIGMEFVEGQSVKEKIKSRPLKLDQALEIAIQTAQGLQAAHEKGIVHRDIKSSNLMVTSLGQVKIMDFGLAQLAERSQLTKTATILGTPAYMSPEQARREPTDRRTDIWSLGVVIYEMVAGRLPFEGERLEAVLYGIGNEEPEPITALRAGLPMDLEWIVSKALAKDLEDRYQHSEDMLVDLRSLQKKLASGKSTILPTGGYARPAVHKDVDTGEPAAMRKPAGSRRLPWTIAGAFALATLTMGFLDWRTEPDSPGLPAAARILQLTTYSGTERDAAISPDGRFFAFVSQMSGRPEIWVRQIVGGDPVPLTKSFGPPDSGDYWLNQIESPLVYSPDGEWIYFASGNSIWRTGALGGSPRKIIDDAMQPAPSPDGQRLAYFRRLYSRGRPAAAGAIEIANADGSSPKKILERPYLSYLSWSPDGGRLAFSSGGLMAIQQVFVIDTDGKNERQVTNFPYGITYGLTWHSDGKHLVVARANDADVIPRTTDLWLVPAAGGSQRRLTLGIRGLLRSPSISANGERILATVARHDREVLKVPLSGSPEENGRAATRLIDDAVDPMWIHSPHGSDLLLVNSIATGTRNLWIYQLDRDVPPRQVTTFSESFVTHASLSPDAEKIAYVSFQSGNGEVWVANVDGSNALQLTHNPAGEFWPTWSPEGEWIMFGSTRTVPEKLWKVAALGGEAVPLTEDSSFRGDWSPSGDRIAYWCERGVEILNLVSGEVEGRYPSRTGLPMFSPDGRQVSFTGPEGSIWIADVETGEARKAVQFPDPRPIMFRVCWSKDAKSLIVNRYQSISHVVMLDNLAEP